MFGAPTVVLRSDGAVVPPTPLWGSEHFGLLADLLDDLLLHAER